MYILVYCDIDFRHAQDEFSFVQSCLFIEAISVRVMLCVPIQIGRFDKADAQLKFNDIAINELHPDTTFNTELNDLRKNYLFEQNLSFC